MKTNIKKQFRHKHRNVFITQQTISSATTQQTQKNVANPKSNRTLKQSCGTQQNATPTQREKHSPIKGEDVATTQGEDTVYLVLRFLRDNTKKLAMAVANIAMTNPM